MEFKFYQILAFLSVASVATHAALPSEVYWNSVLPNSPMPKAVKDLLQPSSFPAQSTSGYLVFISHIFLVASIGWLVEDKSTSVGVSKGGVNVNTGPGKKGGTSVNVGHGSVGVHTGKPGRRTNVGVGRGGVTVGTGTRKGKPVYVGVHPGPKPFNYRYARKVADSIPFSTNKLPEIFSEFSVNPSSDEAEMMRKTIEECEDTTEVKGEEKFCATSLESMIDFSTSKIGKNVKAISTNAESESILKYSIVGVKKMPSEKAVVVCHRQEYAYAVFYCHKTETVSYQVSMVGADGSKAEAVAVCHQDTASWNPKHLAFQVLKVKPGSIPVCHFLPEDHVVWVPKN